MAYRLSEFVNDIFIDIIRRYTIPGCYSYILFFEKPLMHANTLPERRFCFHIKNDVTVNLGQLKPQIGKSNKQNITQSIVLSNKGRLFIWDYFIKTLQPYSKFL
jgi:hypothetical protein